MREPSLNSGKGETPNKGECTSISVISWAGLSESVQHDLQRHRISQQQWDNWSDDQRHQVVNFRARMAGAGLWDDVDEVMFVSVNSDGRTTKATVELEQWKNFLLAFKVKPGVSGQDVDFEDFRRRLVKVGITRDKFFRHKEAEWSHHEGGSGISLHVLGLKPPSNELCEVHFDAHGGNWWNPRHIVHASRRAGPTQAAVTRWLARSPESREHLRGFGEDIDRLVFN